MKPGRAALLVVVAALATAGCQTIGRKKPLPLPPPPAPAPAQPPLIIIRPAPPAPPAPPAKACVPKSLSAAPRYPDTEAALRAAGGAADRYQLLAAGRILRQQRLEELERIIAGCR
jgi:hypothetical protein